MMESRTRFVTPNGSKYLQQLCKHFAHKIKVDFDEMTGRADLPPGPAQMQADETGLTISVSAMDEKGLAVAQHVIEDHLKRFAFREGFTSLVWIPN